jgi:hypothetical protein
MSVSRVNIPILGEFVINWGEGTAQPPADISGNQPVDHQQEGVMQEEHGVPAAVADIGVLPAEDVPVTLPVNPVAVETTPHVADVLSPVEEVPPTVVAAPVVVPAAIVVQQASEEAREKEPIGAERAVPIPSQIPVAEKTGEEKGGASEGDGKSSEEQPLPRTSGDDFAHASPSVRSQLQQPEVVKAALRSPVPLEEALHEQPVLPQQEIDRKAPAPATAAHRDVPAVQEVLRAKVEERVSVYPGLAAQFEAIVGFISGAIEETKAAEIQNHFTTLLDVLIPTFSKETQSKFLSRLDVLHREVVDILEGNDWLRDCSIATTQLISTLEQLNHQAFEEISSILGTGSASEHVEEAPAAAGTSAESESSVVPVVGGWNRKHRRQNKKY